MTDVRLNFVIHGSYDTDPANYESELLGVPPTPENLAQYDQQNLNTPMDLLEWASEYTVKIEPDAMRVVHAGDLIELLQVICTTQQHKVPVMVCRGALCRHWTERLLGLTDDEEDDDVPD